MELFKVSNNKRRAVYEYSLGEVELLEISIIYKCGIYLYIIPSTRKGDFIISRPFDGKKIEIVRMKRYNEKKFFEEIEKIEKNIENYVVDFLKTK